MGFLKRKSVVGLDIGHQTIKAVQVERSGESWRVTRTAIAATPDESVKDNTVVDPVAVASEIRTMLRDADIYANAANIAVSGGSVFMRPILLAPMPEATLRKSIRFEAARYVPGSIDDTLVDFEIIGPAEDGQMSVMLVAAPRDVIDSRVQACVMAGLSVDAVDTEVFALYRALVEADHAFSPQDQTLTIIDVGAMTTTVAVVHGGVFQMTRTIPTGGQALTDSLRSYFRLDQVDAEAGKSQLDLSALIEEAEPQENPPLRVIQPHVDDLIREVRRSINYFQSQQTDGNSHLPIHRVLLTGGGGKMAGLDAYMKSRLDLEVHSLGIYDNPRFVRPDAGTEPGLELAVATGLAMRAHAKAA
jgi:type IV pilus assembly protein PilM